MGEERGGNFGGLQGVKEMVPIMLKIRRIKKMLPTGFVAECLNISNIFLWQVRNTDLAKHLRYVCYYQKKL